MPRSVQLLIPLALLLLSPAAFADIATDARKLLELDGRVFSEPRPETVPADGETAL